MSDSGPYTVFADQSGRCLDVFNWDTSDSAAIVQWECTWAMNQRWFLRGGLHGTAYAFTIRSAHTNKCLQAGPPVSPIVQRTCDGNNAWQLWLLGSSRRWSSAYSFVFYGSTSPACLVQPGMNNGDRWVLGWCNGSSGDTMFRLMNAGFLQ